MWSGLLPKLLKRFQSDFPNANIELQSMRSANQLEAVRLGRVDIGFVSVMPAIGDLEATCVAEERSMLVMPSSNPLARKDRISPGELDGIRWILLSESFSSQKTSQFFGECAKAGFMPYVVQRAAEPITLLALVESGWGVGLVRSSARNYAPRSLKFKILPWFSFTTRTYMVRSLRGRQPLAEAFASRVPEISSAV